MTSTDEKALIQRVATGDRAAMGQLLQTHEKRLYNVCLRMVNNRDDAAELTQDAMVKIVQHLENFRGEAQLTTWMTRIAMNLSISFLRKRRLRTTTSIDAASGASEDDGRGALASRLADPREPGPAQSVQTSEMLDRLHEAIGELDEDQRAVLVLRDIDQMDYQQIAQTLELPVGTVKSRLFRARLAFRERMNFATHAVDKT